MRKELTKFSRFLIKQVMDKPKSKWQAFAHIWDRGLVLGAGVIVTITAFVSNNAGSLLLLIWSLALLFLGLYLTSKGR